MSTNRHHSDHHDLIRRLLEGEGTDADRRALEENPELAAAYEDTLQTRAHLQRSVDRKEVPEGLLAGVMANLESESTRPSNVYEMTPTGKKAFWIFSAVGSIAMTIMIWAAVGGVFGDSDDAPVVADTPLPVNEILQVGMTDHMRCAVSFYRKEIPGQPTEKMKLKVGEEFADLVPIIGREIDLADLVVAHRCSFHGREYVHFVLQGEDDLLMSVAITKRHANEVLQGRAGPAKSVEGYDLHQTTIDGFEIAGFQTEKYLVFVASNLSVEENLRAIEGIVGPVVGNAEL